MNKAGCRRSGVPGKYDFFSPTILECIETQGPKLGSASTRHICRYQGFCSLLYIGNVALVTKVNGESNKIHTANGSSTESNLIRVGEASTKWKATSNTDVASRPLKKDSVKGSSKAVNIKSSLAGLSPVEEVDLV